MAILIPLIVVLLLGGAGFYVLLPAVNLHNPNFYCNFASKILSIVLSWTMIEEK